MKKKSFVFKANAVFLAILIFCSMIPSGTFDGLFSFLFTNVSAADSTEYHNGLKEGVTAPECQFFDQLYDGSDAISPLPKYKQYVENTGYTAPLRISLTDFRIQCGEGLDFNTVAAKKYMNDGYKLMICNAEELYNFSMIVNGSGSADEKAFYLLANIVLGNNIEYTEMSYDDKYFRPIGSDSNPFTGTFDGQGFEIRDLYIDKKYNLASVAFFGVVGSGATVRNFGLFHPFIDTSANNSTFTAGIAGKNYGTINSVYVISAEYSESGNRSVNAIISSIASHAGGLVGMNYEGAELSVSYFAGIIDADNPSNYGPVCAGNEGTVTNCYYDQDVIKYKSGTKPSVTYTNDEIKGLTNLNLKKMNGMEGTAFKQLRAAINVLSTSTNLQSWQYPRLYGFKGKGTKEEPFLISTPADLIYFPNSAEYCSNNKDYYFYFQLENCIDMNEVAPYAYQPSLDLTFYSNQKSGNQYAPFTSSRKNTDAAFFGNFSGAVASDNDCKVEHVHSTSRDANGESLQECHCILNLTINKPAMTASDPSKRYTALIPYVRTINNADYITTVHDIHFIGGEISSGDTDCMPASYSSGAYNVCTATVIGYSNYADMYNVHSSATVKAGTGKQYSVRMGGLMASGYFHRITDCTNSGDIIGGYVEMPAENIQSENYQIGGLLGGAGANSNTLDDRYIGRIIHCANHGNIYSFEVVTDEDNEWKLTGGACYAAGITTGYLATPNTGSTKNNPTGVASYYFDDSKRGGRNANFGMIFDGPIMLDENGDPVFDTDDKPVPLPLSEGKKSVANESPAYQKYIYGIGDNVICNAYNGANLYSVMNEKTHISGIGNCSTAYSSSLGQYYNFLNYNTGNIYMYVGGCEAYGIADKYAYQCYNVGDIFAEGKITTASTYDTSSDSAGCFAGISGYNSRGCYNKGDIYIAPTERALYNGVTTSNNLCIAACGVSIRYADGMEKTVDDEKILYKTINNGTVTIDLEKNNFDPVKNTTDTTNNAYYPRFAMIGTGLGSYNENYGTFDLQLNPNDTTPMIFLRIASCGGVFGNNNHNATTLSHCVNYSDIYVDTTNTENSLYYLFIQGLGYCYGSSAGGINHSINLGDITFKGRIGGDISIRSLSTCSLAKECVNLGDITIDESSVIGGTCEIHDLYCTTSSTTENVMLGWYSGCEMPGNTIETEFEEFFDKLDPNKRYGVKNVSGTFKSYMKVISILGSPTAKSIYNNGATNIENVNAAVNSYQMYIYNLSYSIYCSYCVNNAPITMNNVLMKNNCYVAACSPGNHNLNNADINISHTISQTTQDTRVSAFVSYTNNNNSVTAITSTPSHCENRGNITIKEGMTATVQGTDYDVTSATTTARWRVSGIAQKCSDSINFGKITVSNVHRLSVGGVGAILVGAVSNCLNYGEISCDNCGGWVRVGGITDYTNAYAVDQSYNFAKIIVMNPTSYKATDEPYVYIGGIVAYSLNKTVTSCANYGEIVYNNTKGKNTSSTDYTNTRTTSDLLLCVGGIVGYEQNSAIKSCLNYADVKVDREDNMHIFTGGIVGQSYLTTTTVNENLINYGNVTVPASDSTKKQYVMAGGIIGAPALKRADGNNNSSSNIKRIKYAVNYGTVSASSADDNTYVGSICGMGAFKFINNTTNTFNTDSRYYNIDLCLDLSNPPEDSTFYPLIGGKNNHTNKGTEGNFTKNADSVDDTATAVGTKFGEVKLVTLNKNQDTGVFSAAFPYRSKLSTEVADSTIDLDTNTENVGLNRNLDNLLVYQDYNLLSPYLQEYLVSHFGEEIINQGAYVVLDYDDERNSRPSATTFVPAEMVSGDENDYADTDEYNREMDKLPGLRGTFFNYEFLKGKEVNSLYSELVDPSERTLATDYNFYQQQIDTSSIAEVYNIGAKTKYKYYNTDMGYNAYFTGYNNLVETHPAVDKDGNVSDTVLYTDINIYFGIDDIDTSKAVDDNDETVNTDGYIYINQLVGGNVKGNITGRAGGTTVQYYNGTKLEKTDRIRKASYDYEDEYPTPWLTCDNLDEKLAVEGDWLQEHAWGDSDIEDDQKLWVIQIPKDTNYVYTKVMGVVTAEDGIHKNIIVAHVIIDYYKPNASVDSITLTNPDNTKKVSVTGTPTTNQVLLKSETGKPSLTDFTTETDEETGETIKTPIENVIYYKVVDAAGSTVQNIQRCDYENVTSPPFITISTVNIDSSSQLKCRISRQDRLPQNDQKYNELEWNFDIEYDNNDSTTNPKYTEYITYPTDTYLDDEKKIHGTVTFNLGDSGKNKTFYGGLYRVDLFYERTKTDKDDNNYNYDYVEWKHFATVFYAKEHSPYNILSNSSNSPLTARYTGNNAFLTRLPIYTNPGNDTKSMAAQGAYDREHDPDIQTGYLAVKRTMYQWNPVLYYDYTRTENDTKTDNRGYYYAYKAYVAKARGEDFVLNQHDPEESQRITKHLENRYKEIYVYCNEATGAYYPQIFKGSMEIMAENGDIRKYTTELVQNGTYGNYPENNGNKATYDNAPNIYQTAATKGGYPIIKSEDGTFVGVIGGTEKEDVTFTCTWTSSNVTLFKNSNRPSTINQNHIYDDDGYKEENVNIYFTPINSTQERKLTNDEIARYFNGNLSVSTSNVWTIKLKNSAPVGDYKIVPYMTYTMDLRSGQDPADDDKIKLYDFNDYGKAEKNILKTSETNIFTWRIPYTPFVIKNIPNDDSYLTEFHESQSKNTPFISEESNVEGSANRSVFIRTASEHGEIVYSKSYDSVKVGEENNRVRKFNIYAFVGKSDTNSNLRMKVPYLAEMYQWNGSGVPDPNDTVYWKSMSPDNSDDTEKIYSCNVSYNAIDPDTHENNFEKSVTYYKILAEDGVTYTIYQVEVIPGVRNKTTTFEVAQKAEIDDFKSSEEFNSTIGSIFEESDKLYQEILENGGTVVGTIKELGGEQILYQTKIFENEYANGASEPYIYNLKSFVFDISVDLPAGYDYEIYNFSEGKDSYTILNDSKNGYSGKELILNNSADQTLNLRIVIKRASTSQIWGVQYLWDYGNAVADEAGKILSGQGGKFYNYVYKRED